MTLEKTGEWQLGSGTWHVNDLADRDQGPQLVRTRLGHEVASALEPADIAVWMGMRAGVDGSALYPPDFQHSPLSGAALPPVLAPGAPWIAPSGSNPLRKVSEGQVVGLRQSTVPLALSRLDQRHDEEEPDVSMALPPGGEYQFISAPFVTRSNALLALDPAKGALFAWLPASKRWVPLHGVGGVFLAESALPYAAWRAELHGADNGVSRLYVATDAGLACLTVDLPALQYEIAYTGDSEALGAPLAFQNLVWAPVKQGLTAVQLVCFNADAGAGASVTLELPVPLAALRDMGAPVSYGRKAVWPGSAGQLLLQRKPDGSFAAQFLAWPAGMAPQFAFGSPYLAKDGKLWQLCFDFNRKLYAYVMLGVAEPEVQYARGPRLCSGAMNYRFASKSHQPPWEDPDQGDDGGANALIVPLLEAGQQTIGIKLRSTNAVAETLRTSERMRVQLVWDDHRRETVFNTSIMPEPWKLRLFVHDAVLWAYHPELKEILGWKLNA